jgi:hypothetical protein
VIEGAAYAAPWLPVRAESGSLHTEYRAEHANKQPKYANKQPNTPHKQVYSRKG